MVKIDSENGKVSVQMDGHVGECLADAVCAVHAMCGYFRDRPNAFNTFKSVLTDMVTSGLMFEDLRDDAEAIVFSGKLSDW